MNAVEVFNFLIPKLSLCYSAIGKYLIRMALQQTKHFYQNLVVIFLINFSNTLVLPNPVSPIIKIL